MLFVIGGWDPSLYVLVEKGHHANILFAIGSRDPHSNVLSVTVQLMLLLIFCIMVSHSALASLLNLNARA